MASTLMRLPFTTLACGRLVRRSAAVFSMGGYVAGPPVMAALLRRRPVVVMEPNAVPGFTNRIIGRFVSRALVSFRKRRRSFPPAAPSSQGCRCARNFSGFRRKPRGPVLEMLITGGSQGSRTLNQAARESWPLFRKSRMPVRIVHQTGAAAFESVREGFAQSGLAGEVVPFITDMPAAFAAADLVVCRSGAGAVSELAAAGQRGRCWCRSRSPPTTTRRATRRPSSAAARRGLSATRR